MTTMQVEPLPREGRYRLCTPVVIAAYVIPAGFCWDGASTPRRAWSALGYTPFHPALMFAAVRQFGVHTWRDEEDEHLARARAQQLERVGEGN